VTGNKRSELYYTPWVSGHALYDDDDRRRHHHYYYCSLNYEEMTHCTFYDHPHHDKVNTLQCHYDKYKNTVFLSSPRQRYYAVYFLHHLHPHHDKDATLYIFIVIFFVVITIIIAVHVPIQHVPILDPEFAPLVGTNEAKCGTHTQSRCWYK